MKSVLAFLLTVCSLTVFAERQVIVPINYTNEVLSAAAFAGFSYYNPQRGGKLDNCSGVLVSKIVAEKRRYFMLTVQHHNKAPGFEIRKYLVALGVRKLPSEVRIAFLNPNELHWCNSDEKFDMSITDITDSYDENAADSDDSQRFVDLESIGDVFRGDKKGLLKGVGVARAEDFGKLKISAGQTVCITGIAAPEFTTNGIVPFKTTFHGLEALLSNVNTEVEIYNRSNIDETPLKHIVHQIALPNKDGFSGGGVYAKLDDGRMFLIGIITGGGADHCDIIPIEHVYDLIDSCFKM